MSQRRFYIEEAYKKMRRLFTYAAWDITHSDQAAEDCVHDAVIKCLEESFDITSIEHASNVIKQCARWNAMHHNRDRNARRRNNEIYVSKESGVIAQVSIDYYPLNKIVIDEVMKMKPRFQHILEAHSLGLPRKAIGEMYGITDRAVDQIVNRAMHKIKNQLRKKGINIGKIRILKTDKKQFQEIKLA